MENEWADLLQDLIIGKKIKRAFCRLRDSNDPNEEEHMLVVPHYVESIKWHGYLVECEEPDNDNYLQMKTYYKCSLPIDIVLNMVEYHPEFERWEIELVEGAE